VDFDLVEEVNELLAMLSVLIAENLIQHQEARFKPRTLTAEDRDGDPQHNRQQCLLAAREVSDRM